MTNGVRLAVDVGTNGEIAMSASGTLDRLFLSRRARF